MRGDRSHWSPNWLSGEGSMVVRLVLEYLALT